MSQRTLLLNATYEPLAVVPLRRAVILILAEKAEVVDVGADKVRSANTSMPIPKVIRLNRFVRVPYSRRVPLTRANVLKRDNHTCAYCGGPGDTMDHIVPKALGGKHEWRNIVTACRRCNGKKGHQTLDALGWKLGFKPFEPAGTTAFVVIIGNVDEAWEPYLAAA